MPEVDAGRPRDHWRLAVVGCAMVGGCLVWRHVSSPERFLLVTAAQVGLFLLAVSLLRHRAGHLAVIWIVAIVMRLVWLSDAPPQFDDDIWRYRWDGHVVASGHNPYALAPMDDALDAVDDGYRLNVSFPWLRTIYPPGAEALFGVVAWLAPHGVLWPWRVAMLIPDMACGLLLSRHLRRHGRPDTVLLYLWHPLVIKEIADSAHVDAWAVLAILASLVGSGWWRGLSLAAGVGFKITPATLAPRLLDDRRSWAAFGTTIALLIALASWRAPSMAALMGGWQTFAAHWEFNSTGYAVLAWLSHWGGLPPASARIVSTLAIVIGVALVYWRRRDGWQAVAWIYGIILVWSPVANPWYCLPFAALATQANGPMLLTASLVPLLSYAHYLNEGDIWYRLLEVACVLTAAAWQWHVVRKEPVTAANSAPPSP